MTTEEQIAEIEQELGHINGVQFLLTVVDKQAKLLEACRMLLYEVYDKSWVHRSDCEELRQFEKKSGDLILEIESAGSER